MAESENKQTAELIKGRCFSCKGSEPGKRGKEIQFSVEKLEPAKNQKTEIAKGVCPDCGKKVCCICSKSRHAKAEESEVKPVVAAEKSA